MPAGFARPGDVVANAEKRLLEVFDVQIDVLFDDGQGLLGRSGGC